MTALTGQALLNALPAARSMPSANAAETRRQTTREYVASTPPSARRYWPLLRRWAEDEEEDRGVAVELDVASGCDHGAAGRVFDG